MNKFNILIADLAVASLIAEVDATPKPGLVDRANTGAHRDMDHGLFIKSAQSLHGYFYEIAKLGQETGSLSPEEAFLHLRPAGVRAEEVMLGATGGVNTHKGAIFSMGLGAAAAGRLGGQGFTPALLLDTAAAFVSGICKRELTGLEEPKTKGERAYQQHGYPGARGEAQGGFPSVRNHGLPAYLHALQAEAGEETALLYALVHLIAHMQDTNIVTRLSQAEGEYARQSALRMLKAPHRLGSAEWLHMLQEMDKVFIARNISPGGCADMLALTHFVHAISTRLI